MSLRVHAASVAIGRCFARDVVSGHSDDDHAYTIALLVSELLTNALRAAAAVGEWEPQDRPVKLGVLSTERWVRLSVTDPDPNPIDPGARPENGYGLGIVNTLAALPLWTTHAADSKTVHVAVAAPGITLTAAELQALRC
ncbi:MAG: ATP-binding protein [Actinoallomurus sp.]